MIMTSPTRVPVPAPPSPTYQIDDDQILVEQLASARPSQEFDKAVQEDDLTSVATSRPQSALDTYQPGRTEEKEDDQHPHEDEEREAKPTLPPPQATGWAPWSVVLGSHITMFLSFGFLNSFAAFQSYYFAVKLKGYSNSDIAWIGSMQTFWVFAANLFVGPVFDKHGPKPLLILAAFVFVFGCMMTSLANKYYQIFLAQGVVVGASLGIAFITPMACVMQWFHTKNRAAALGIAMSGSSIGGVVWTIVTKNLLDKVGYGWTWRTLGFMGMALFPICIVLVRMPPHIIEAQKKMKAKKPELSLDAFLNVNYTVMTITMCVFVLGFMPLLFYFPELAGYHGSSRNMQFYSISILNAVSFIGRMGMPILSQWTGIWNTSIVCLAFTSIVAFCCMAVDSSKGAIVAASFFGLTSGAALSLIVSCVPMCIPNFSKLGAQMGQMFFVASICGLLTGSIGGWIMDTKKHGNWKALEGYVGGCLICVVCGLAFLRNRLQPNWKKIY